MLTENNSAPRRKYKLRGRYLLQENVLLQQLGIYRSLADVTDVMASRKNE